MLSIVARDVCVEFPIFDTYGRSLRHKLGLGRIARSLNKFAGAKRNVGGMINASRQGRVVIRALDGLSFTLSEGDRVGLLGHNGSGKTTLLRTLAGIYEPIAGELRTSGNVIPLFDLQLGMDPDATGFENIWLRGQMLHLTADQIEEALDNIADFTELGDYLYMPIRTYSQGMILRLAFAISTAIVPEILVLDEMIGAGDAGFLSRAEVRLSNFLQQARILAFASHNVELLRRWCNKGMLLERGKLVAFGPLDEVIEQYRLPRK
jgi:ABC-type polysaccharide/polyol phosphate transport system ATPase subunit